MRGALELNFSKEVFYLISDWYDFRALRIGIIPLSELDMGSKSRKIPQNSLKILINENTWSAKRVIRYEIKLSSTFYRGFRLLLLFLGKSKLGNTTWKDNSLGDTIHLNIPLLIWENRYKFENGNINLNLEISLLA